MAKEIGRKEYTIVFIDDCIHRFHDGKQEIVVPKRKQIKEHDHSSFSIIFEHIGDGKQSILEMHKDNDPCMIYYVRSGVIKDKFESCNKDHKSIQDEFQVILDVHIKKEEDAVQMLGELWGYEEESSDSE